MKSKLKILKLHETTPKFFFPPLFSVLFPRTGLRDRLGEKQPKRENDIRAENAAALIDEQLRTPENTENAV